MIPTLTEEAEPVFEGRDCPGGDITLLGLFLNR